MDFYDWHLRDGLTWPGWNSASGSPGRSKCPLYPHSEPSARQGMRSFDVFPIRIGVIPGRGDRTHGNDAGKTESGIETSDQPSAISRGRVTRFTRPIATRGTASCRNLRARLLGPLERGELPLQRPEKPQRTDERRTPLLNWTSHPAPP